jgi:hypothetical protein
LTNSVHLSLRSGIRVSPRYHPIRGVPSDFLRNRLLLSFGKGARNWVGERLGDLSSGRIHLRDFFLGCIHADLPNLFLIGFARPIIGNIPSISEMQAMYTVGALAGKYNLPADMQGKQAQAWEALCAEYPAINTENVYPVEHFTYCDILAREMGILPTLANVRSLRTWWKIHLTPISTFHYLDEYFDGGALDRQKVYMPVALVGFLAVMRVLGTPFRVVRSLWVKDR